eukprot:GFYU01007974.1.p1 GENE.GFYU01007974.1~~GFYU01007974.1.p1  ORF type:complete len:506 (-),score=184.98 GFYU01007974.1:197-1648(-)
MTDRLSQVKKKTRDISHEELQKYKFSEPLAELPVKNAKYITACHELFMGHKGIERLTGFDIFPKLENLWLNDNQIDLVEGLEENFRLRCLYLQNNKITTLKGAVKNNRFLQILLISNNRLRNMARTIDAIKHLQFLEKLELFGNPLAEEHNYRLYVIHKMPSLKVLDRHVITDIERQEAHDLYVGAMAEKIAFGKKIEVYEKPIIPPKDAPSLMVQDMWKEIKQIEKERKRVEEENFRATLQQKEAVKKASEEMPIPNAIDFLKKAKESGPTVDQLCDEPLSESELERVREQFNAIDTNGNGILTRGEMIEMLKQGSRPVTEEDIEDILLMMDFDMDNQITWEEFLRGYTLKYSFDLTDVQKQEYSDEYFERARKWMKRGDTATAMKVAQQAITLKSSLYWQDVKVEEERAAGRFDTLTTYHYAFQQVKEEEKKKRGKGQVSRLKASIPLDKPLYTKFMVEEAKKEESSLSTVKTDVTRYLYF